MRLYDFDGSLYQGALLRNFFVFCLLRRPKLLLCLPCLAASFLRCHFQATPYTPFWQRIYEALAALHGREHLVLRFWSQRRRTRLAHAGFADLEEDALLLSPAPDFLLAPLNGQFLAAGFDAASQFSSMQTGAVRLQRLHRHFPEVEISAYFGARLSDHTLAEAATHCCYQRGRIQRPWAEFVAQQGRYFGWLSPWISPEFFRFWCVGWLNLIGAFLLEGGFGLILPKNLGFSLGYACSLLLSFSLNSLITFRRKLNFARLFHYVLSYVPNFLVQFTTVFLLHNLLGLPYLLCCFLAAVVGTPVTFVCLKLFAFRGRD